MSKRGRIELYLFLVIAIVAMVGLVHTMLSGAPVGMWGEGIDCQSQCFGTEPGTPIVGQESLGGSNLRQCLSTCQAGVSRAQQQSQECYTCNGGGGVQKLTASDQSEAHIMCTRVAGSSATLTSVTPGPCPY